MKYWDIKPPKKKKKYQKHRDQYEKIQKLIEEFEKKYEHQDVPPYIVPAPRFKEGCLHNGCNHSINPICTLYCPYPCCSPISMSLRVGSRSIL